MTPLQSFQQKAEEAEDNALMVLACFEAECPETQEVLEHRMDAVSQLTVSGTQEIALTDDAEEMSSLLKELIAAIEREVRRGISDARSGQRERHRAIINRRPIQN